MSWPESWSSIWSGARIAARSWRRFGGLRNAWRLLPVLEPSPNLLAQSRMRLDDALDMIPPHGFLTQLRTNFYRWMGNVQSAPALATLLLGVGFLSGNFTHRYQVAHAPKPKTGPVTVSHPTEGVVANVTGIVQTPNSELVQVNYNKIVPESMEGSLDSPEIRNLLLVGTNAAATDGVRMNSVSLLTNECKAGHACQPTADGKGIRHALMVSLRYDPDAGVRMKALEGLQQYRRAGSACAGCGAGGGDARFGCAGATDGDWSAGAGAVGLERAAGAADGRDAGCESVYSDGVVQRVAELCVIFSKVRGARLARGFSCRRRVEIEVTQMKHRRIVRSGGTGGGIAVLDGGQMLHAAETASVVVWAADVCSRRWVSRMAGGPRGISGSRCAM